MNTPATAALGPSAGEAAWLNAAAALALFAVDPHGLGGLHLQAGAGGVRDRWLADLKALLPADEPLRRLPGHIADDRLLGGLDLSATLASGKPVAQRGLLAEAHGGVVLVPMAERLGAAHAARLAAVLDSAEVGFERDGLSSRWPARLGVVAMDEGGEDDHPLPAALRDRLALHADLRGCSLRDLAPCDTSAAQVRAARAHLPQVQVEDRLLQALCGTALQLGVVSLRASQHALRATRAAAALAGRETATEEDAQLAARLVLAPLATRLPPAEDDSAEPPEPPPPEPPEPPEPPKDETPPPPADEPENTPEPQTLEDRIVEATVAALPAGLLAALQSQLAASQAGRVGALSASPRSGRPVGTRTGSPRGGARLNLIETLRAAAPWQPLRRRAAESQGRRAGLIHVSADDLRISRLQQRAATATLFVLDASGSSALHRLGEAKGAVNLLLADCYVRRDQVAVIAFRGRSAELLLPPTRSLVRAKRSLAALPGGGGTPLALGLEAALRLADQVRRSGATPVVVLLTDGRANITRSGETGRAQAEADAIAMARQLRAARLTALVVDTSPQPAIAAQRLAAEMAATYRTLPYAGAAALSAAVRALPTQTPAPRG
ncbi:magnesium chelatase [beta proteobacterium AAP51]|nr:magnesium chelatase [beta proteobacterium AAP51]